MGEAATALPVRDQRAYQRQDLRCLRRLVEKKIGAETETELLVFHVRVIGEDCFHRGRQQITLLQRFQHVEARAGFQSDVDQDQIRLQHRQIRNCRLRVRAVTDQICACRLDRRCKQPANNRRVLDDIDLQRFEERVDGRLLRAYVRMLDRWPRVSIERARADAKFRV